MSDMFDTPIYAELLAEQPPAQLRPATFAACVLVLLAAGVVDVAAVMWAVRR